MVVSECLSNRGGVAFIAGGADRPAGRARAYLNSSIGARWRTMPSIPCPASEALGGAELHARVVNCRGESAFADWSRLSCGRANPYNAGQESVWVGGDGGMGMGLEGIGNMGGMTRRIRRVRWLALWLLAMGWLATLGAGCGVPPGGKALAFGRGGQLWTIQADGSDVHRIASGGIVGLAWSPDHHQLVYRTTTHSHGAPASTPLAPAPNSLGDP